MAALTMDKLVALCKNKGYIFAGSEIYGGLSNTWDYGPLGVEFKNNVKKAWWRKFVQECPYNTGVDCAILMNREVLYVNKEEGYTDGAALQRDFDEWVVRYSSSWLKDNKRSGLPRLREFISNITKIR